MSFWKTMAQNVAGPLVGGVMGIAGESGARKWNAEQANINRQFNAAEAQKARGFSERMRNTQWQAGVADMRAAGLNPALAYSQGGAASPGGSQASGSAASGANNKALAALQYSNLKAQTAKLNEEARLTGAKADVEQGTSRWLLDPRSRPASDGSLGLEYFTQLQRQLQAGLDQSESGVLRTRAQTGQSEQAARREAATADTMAPMAALARQMGMLFPLLALMAPGGAATQLLRRGTPAAGLLARKMPAVRPPNRIGRLSDAKLPTMNPQRRRR